MSDPTVTSNVDQNIGIVGVGLIGGSIAAALKKRGFEGEIVGCGRSASRLEAARTAGLIDTVTTDLAQAARGCRLLLFCTPVDRIVEGVLAAASHSSAGTLISDAGSVKGLICRGVAHRLPEGVTFIGSHPLAGSEQQGFEHADADLFNGRVCVVTPDEQTPANQLSRLTAFWRLLGLNVIEMAVDDHDRALAETSHLPHVVAAALASTLSERNRSLAATGFRDTTRVAAGHPELWVPILLGNSEEVVRSIDAHSQKLEAIRDAIANHDSVTLKKLLQAAKNNRGDGE